VQLPAIGSGGLPSDWQERTEYPVGFGIDRARATVGSDRQGHVLQFYGDQPENLPAACEKVELSFNCAGRAMGRVRDAASVATLAAKFGAPNDGVRTKIVTDFSPTIRRDEDAYNAAAALLDDSTSMQYDGTYVGLLDTFCTKRPMPGRHIYVNEPRVSAQNFLVSQVEQLIFGDAAALVDRSEFSLTFGTVLDADMFAAKLRAMEGMKIQGAETEVLKPVDLQNIAISYLVDSVEDWTVEVLPNYDNSSLNFRLTIMSPLPAGCGVEIRKWDRGWGQYSDATKDYGLVARGEIGQRVFVLPRKSRKQIFYMRLFKEQS
jgi:hypothetical protein